MEDDDDNDDGGEEGDLTSDLVALGFDFLEGDSGSREGCLSAD